MTKAVISMICYLKPEIDLGRNLNYEHTPYEYNKDSMKISSISFSGLGGVTDKRWVPPCSHSQYFSM